MQLKTKSEKPRHVAIFRALQLGDLLCSVPALRALRHALPESKITLIGLPWARIFRERFSRYLDDFIEFPGFPGQPEIAFDAHLWLDFLEAVQSENFDLAIQMHGAGTQSNPVVSLLGAKEMAGYYRPGEFCPNENLFIPYSDVDPEIWRHLRLMQAIGVEPQGEYLEFEVEREDYARLCATLGSDRVNFGKYVCLHPGARAEGRRWNPDYFAEVADELSHQGFRVVLTGSKDEADLSAQILARMKSQTRERTLPLTGKTDLGTLAALLAGARLLICNDTGVSHLAAALRVRSLVIFPQSDRAGWPPLDRQLHRAVCCFTGVKPEDVLKHAMEVL